MPKTLAEKIDDLPHFEAGVAVAGTFGLMALPGYGVDRVMWLLPVLMVALFAAFFWLLRSGRAFTLGVCLGVGLYSTVHAVNRLAERKAPAVEQMNVVEVDPPHGRYSGHTIFTRPGQTERLQFQSGWHAEAGRPLKLVFHEGALGLRWVDEAP